MKLLFLFLAAWAPRVTHPVKDAATHEMLRAVSQEHDRAVREEARDALDFIAGSLDTNLVIALPAVDTTGWSDADVERHLQAPEVLLQEAAVRAAGERGLTNAVPVLTVMLRDSDERLRGAVCESLAQLRRGAPVVAKLLEVEPSVRVRAKAVTALLCSQLLTRWYRAALTRTSRLPQPT